jgi:hypothetical protein
MRRSQSCHSVERSAFDGNFDLPMVKGTRRQLASEYGFESKYCVFGQTLSGVAARGSPNISALHADRAQGCVARHTPSW